ncbi:MAG: cytochrome c peroxidase [Bacteroidota bacterium]
MKKYWIISLCIIALVSAGALHESPTNQYQLALDQVTSQFRGGLNEFATHIDRYEIIAAELTPDDESIQELQDIHLATRLAFKDVEFLMEYYDAAGVKQSINGAPLPKTEPKVADLRIIEPKGLQILDELTFSEDPYAEKDEIIRLITQLKAGYGPLHRYQSTVKVYHRHVFESVRQELVRIFTLGVTGFDTPGSVNAIPEAKNAMSAISASMESYIPIIQGEDKRLADKLTFTFDGAISFLDSHQDFDSFDRLTFLIDYINPLYAMTGQVHRKLGVESWKEAGLRLPAVNYQADNLFAADFLNPDFYSGLVPNDLTEQRAKLGKTLFYDAVLSKDYNMSCGSCHDPAKAFTDGQVKSLSNDGVSTVQRNAPTLINAVFAEKFFLDLRETIFEKQMSHVVTHHKEFDMDYISLMERLEEHDYYGSEFQKAYPEQGVSPHGITNSLSNYVATLVSFESPFDQYVRGESDVLSESAKRGFNIFMGKGACGTCHFAPTFNGTVPPLFAESESEVLGVPATTDTIGAYIDPDIGRIGNQRPLDEAEIYRHSFKTVTARNVTMTAPYMHNGVYETLEEVVHFYNIGGGVGLGFEVPNQTLPFDSLGLTTQEEMDLVAFMEALTDETILSKFDDGLPSAMGGR